MGHAHFLAPVVGYAPPPVAENGVRDIVVVHALPLLPLTMGNPVELWTSQWRRRVHLNIDVPTSTPLYKLDLRYKEHHLFLDDSTEALTNGMCQLGLQFHHLTASSHTVVVKETVACEDSISQSRILCSLDQTSSARQRSSSASYT